MNELSKIELIAPTLHRLLSDKTIYVVDGNFRGKAADGVEVSFGDMWNIPAIERYLQVNPSPNSW